MDVPRDPANDFWWNEIGARSNSGQTVSVLSSRQLSAVNACVRVLSDAIASLPLNIHERVPGGGSRIAENHPLQFLLHDAPNGNETSFNFRKNFMASKITRGNAYAQIIPGPRGAVDSLVMLETDTVQPRRLDTGRVVYQINPRGEAPRVLVQEEVWHIYGERASTADLKGLAPIEREALNVLGAAQATQDYSARFFANDGKPGGVIEHPGHFGSDEARTKFLASWQAAQTGANRHSTAVLEDGLKYEAFQITNEQAQFLETRKYQDVEIARLFGVPPHLLGIFDGATRSNVEQQALDFLKFGLLPHIVAWEQSINANLITNTARFFAKFNVAGMLRGELRARYMAYAIGRNWGWLSPNDIRKMEDMNPLAASDGGDDYLRPGNMLLPEDAAEPSGQGDRRNLQNGANGASLPLTENSDHRANGAADEI